MGTDDDVANARRDFGLRMRKRIGYVIARKERFRNRGGFVTVSRDDGRAGDGVGTILLRWLEGDIIAESWGLDDHEVGTGRNLFDE